MAQSLARATRTLQALSLALLAPTAFPFAPLAPARAKVWIAPGVYRHYYHVGRGPAFIGAGNCRAGLLNGLPPQNLSEAELLNAACHVAYGPAGR